MAVRENLVFFIGIIFILLLGKYEKPRKFSIILLLSLFLTYIMMSHFLVFLIIGSTTFIYFLLAWKNDKKYKFRLILVLIIPAILNLPNIISLIQNVINQMLIGKEIVQSQGHVVSYFFLNSSYFRDLDPFFLAIGVSVILSKFRFFLKKYSSLIVYSFVVLIGTILSYIEIFGSKQNRFAIYLYLSLAFFLVVTLSFLKSKNKLSKKSLILLILFLITSFVLSSINYSAYRPINEENVDFLRNQYSLLNSYDSWNCGRSAETIFRFFDIELNKCLEINISDSGKFEGPIILTSEDFYYLQNINYSIDLSDRVIIFDELSKTRIYLPSLQTNPKK